MVGILAFYNIGVCENKIGTMKSTVKAYKKTRKVASKFLGSGQPILSMAQKAMESFNLDSYIDELFNERAKSETIF